MIHTNMSQNCTVFLIRCELTRSAILWSQNFYRKKENRTILRDVCVDYYVLLLNYLSNHMHFITNASKHFSTDQSNVYL